jgi:tRNA (guanine-N7-)-methyltransferase
MLSLKRRIAMGETAPPTDWATEFGRRAPLEVDLGCGHGAFVLDRAHLAPSTDFLALDARRKWIAQLRAEIARHALPNVRAVWCDLQQDLPALFTLGSVTGFTIHHPDPWWKIRHRKRRLVQLETASMLADLLRPGGWLYLQTDVPALAAEAEAAFQAQPTFAQLDAERFLAETLGGVLSHRGRRCAQQGIPVTRLAFRRLQGEAP